MTLKSILSAVAAVAMTASFAIAQPSLDVSGTANGSGGIDWTVEVTHNSAGSVALEFALETDLELDLGSVVADPLFMETIDGTLIENPGNDPFAGAVTDGITTYDAFSGSVVAGSSVGDPFDAFFAALGSTDFGDGGTYDDPAPALTFTTTGSESGTVYFEYILAQEGAISVAASGSTEVAGSTLEADFNKDGVVDVLDLDILGTNFNMPGDMSMGDANMDGVVDVLDLDVLGTQFNTSAASSITAAPEPVAGFLGLVGVAAVSVVRRRR